MLWDPSKLRTNKVAIWYKAIFVFGFFQFGPERKCLLDSDKRMPQDHKLLIRPFVRRCGVTQVIEIKLKI